MSNSMDALGWTTPIWDRIRQAVHGQTQRMKIGQKILPLNATQNAMNVPSDITLINKNGVLEVTEGDSKPLIETIVKYSMTKTQVQQEQQLSTAPSLAMHAAGLISGAQDQIIFQGINAKPKGVDVRWNGNNDNGLVNAGKTVVTVKSPIGTPGQYGEETFTGVTKGTSLLQNNGHYGPYALVLHTDVYADTYTPLKGTLVTPANSIMPIVEGGFYGSGNIPKNTGVLLSVGGNTMDLTVGVDTTPEFMFLNASGMYSFRLYERFTLRLKDDTAVVTLNFK
jgi:uncharacterized linocin/CFP29 family protein